MGENTKIEWTASYDKEGKLVPGYTFNPWIGCQNVSPGCDHCYAEVMMDHRYGRVKWGPHGERVRTSPGNWRKPLQWAKAANGNRPRVFCASLADVFDNKAPAGWHIVLHEADDRQETCSRASYGAAMAQGSMFPLAGNSDRRIG